MTRDVTAWAWPWAAVRSGSPMSPTDVGHSGIGPVLLAICSRPGTRPGPFSRQAVVRRRADRRFDRGCIRRDRSPNRVAWRCTELEGRGISRAARCSGQSSHGGLLRRAGDRLNMPAGTIGPVPGPVPRIGLGSMTVTSHLQTPGSDAWLVGGISPRGAEAPLAATLTRIATWAFL